MRHAIAAGCVLALAVVAWCVQERSVRIPRRARSMPVAAEQPSTTIAAAKPVEPPAPETHARSMDLVSRIDATEDPLELLRVLILLGNECRIGSEEVRSLLRLLDRTEHEMVLCHVFWALGLAEETYPFDRALDTIGSSGPAAVRAAAVASLARHADPMLRRALLDALRRDRDLAVRQEAARSLVP